MNKCFEKRLKVLFFISSLAGGGAERVMVDILKDIDKDKFEPLLVLLYPYDDSPYRQYLPTEMRIIVAKRATESPFEKIKQFSAFLGICRRERPDVILSMLTHNNIMAILAGSLFGIKVIVSEHNTLSEVINTKEGSKIFGFPVAPLVKVLYRVSHKIIAVSGGIKDDLIKKFGIATNRISVIYNPIDLKRIAELSNIPAQHPFFENNTPVVIAIGRLTVQKRFDILIKAFNLVLSEMDARLIILGEGEERQSLQMLINNLGINERVCLAGFQGNPFSFLARADVFALSSAYEGLSMVILEAMACGLPVIATDCKSGPHEILNGGRCGILTPTGDAEALAQGIIKLLKDEPLRERLGRLGLERARDFSSDKIIKQYEDLIYSICN